MPYTSQYRTLSQKQSSVAMRKHLDMIGTGIPKSPLHFNEIAYFSQKAKPNRNKGSKPPAKGGCYTPLISHSSAQGDGGWQNNFQEALFSAAFRFFLHP